MNKNDKKYFHNLGAVLSSMQKKVTRYQKIRETDFVKYLHFINGSRAFLKKAKKKFTNSSDAEAAHICHKRAKKLHLLKNA